MARSRRKTARAKLRKVVDDSMTVRSTSGQTGSMREEVWVNQHNEVARYNLAYINFHLFQGDNGRVLGYDNAHGYHERHYLGKSEKASFSTYQAKARHFYSEVQKLREQS